MGLEARSPKPRHGTGAMPPGGYGTDAIARRAAPYCSIRFRNITLLPTI